MSVTDTARVLPSNLLPPSSTVSTPFKFETTAAPSAGIAMASTFSQDSQPSSSFSKVKTPYTKSNESDHLSYNGSLIMKRYYFDHASDQTIDPNLIKYKAKGGVIVPFPVKLHKMLDKIESYGLANVVSWASHGRCFRVHKPKEFVNIIMPHYFKQTKMDSFYRQLNLYGFNRLTRGPDKGGYYHEMFLRGKVSLGYEIHPKRVKGTGVRWPTNPKNEPNFYAMPPVTKHALPSIPSMDVTSTALPPVPVPSEPIVDVALSFDHASDQTIDPNLIKYKAKGGVIVPFPVKLHKMLDKIESYGLANVVSWASHGRCFRVHKPKEFVNNIMPHYFKQTKMASFHRQLNVYGFNRLTGGPDKGDCSGQAEAGTSSKDR